MIAAIPPTSVDTAPRHELVPSKWQFQGLEENNVPIENAEVEVTNIFLQLKSVQDGGQYPDLTLRKNIALSKDEQGKGGNDVEVDYSAGYVDWNLACAVDATSVALTTTSEGKGDVRNANHEKEQASRSGRTSVPRGELDDAIDDFFRRFAELRAGGHFANAVIPDGVELPKVQLEKDEVEIDYTYGFVKKSLYQDPTVEAEKTSSVMQVLKEEAGSANVTLKDGSDSATSGTTFPQDARGSDTSQKSGDEKPFSKEPPSGFLHDGLFVEVDEGQGIAGAK